MRLTWQVWSVSLCQWVSLAGNYATVRRLLGGPRTSWCMYLSGPKQWKGLMPMRRSPWLDTQIVRRKHILFSSELISEQTLPYTLSNLEMLSVGGEGSPPTQTTPTQETVGRSQNTSDFLASSWGVPGQLLVICWHIRWEKPGDCCSVAGGFSIRRVASI